MVTSGIEDMLLQSVIPPRCLNIYLVELHRVLFLDHYYS